MGKVRNDQSGFGAVEILLALILIAIIAFTGVYVAYNHNNKTTSNTVATSKTTATKPTTITTHTSQEAVTFVQKTYDDYLKMCIRDRYYSLQ